MLFGGDSRQIKRKSRKRTVAKKSKPVYEFIRPGRTRLMDFEGYHKGIFDALKDSDRQVYELLAAEHRRFRDSIQLIAAENYCSQAVLAALGSVVQNKTSEGVPGDRLHAGSGVVDEIEELAARRACRVFSAKYANVQPHSGTQANQIVLAAILAKDDRILGLGLGQGGHPSHGDYSSFTGRIFQTHSYGVDKNSFLLDYEAVRRKALEIRPKLIICGASAYSRVIDFAAFREIADEAGSYLLADISHIAGLIMAGAHPSSIEHAHFTTTSTYKPGGPRGGLILMGNQRDKEVCGVALAELIDKATFPGVQGTPYLNNIAAKAAFFKEAASSEYQQRQFRIIENAKSLAGELCRLGYDVVTGGTDNHMVLVDISRFKKGLTGVIVQDCLEKCGIITNMTRLPCETADASVASGIRLGTPIVTKNGMSSAEMAEIAGLIDVVVKNVRPVNQKEYELDESIQRRVQSEVIKLARRFTLIY